MEWNSQQTEKPELILKFSGFDTQKQSSIQSPSTTDFQQNNIPLLEISSSDQTTGESTFYLLPELEPTEAEKEYLSSHFHSENQSDKKNLDMSTFTSPLESEDIEEYVRDFDTLQKVQEEIRRLQRILAQIESKEFKLTNPPYYVKQLVCYFTQLFKAVLIKKEKMANP
jgi:hypothetical protein